MRGSTPPDAILIDYMQLIRQKGSRNFDSRQSEVAAISNGLKQLARELNIPIIALAQLSRRVEQRENKVPIMSDLRESGSIEQDADLIMFLYRDAYYRDKEDKSDGTDISRLEDVDVIVAKHRNGETGKFTLIFNKSLGKFSSIPKNHQ
jgi:replicative DNA helicase